MEPSAGDILLVEDDDTLGDILATVLQDQGYRVALASNGKEAIDYLRTGQRPRLILLNLVMPALNGWKLHQQIKMVPELAEIPVIVLSGVDNLQRKAAALGANEYLVKPYNINTLLDSVRHYCQPSRVGPKAILVICGNNEKAPSG